MSTHSCLGPSLISTLLREREKKKKKKKKKKERVFGQLSLSSSLAKSSHSWSQQWTQQQCGLKMSSESNFTETSQVFKLTSLVFSPFTEIVRDIKTDGQQDAWVRTHSH